MSLHVRIQGSIDLTAPIGAAKDALLAHIDADPILEALLSGNAPNVALGGLSDGLAVLEGDALSSPATMLAPLTEAFARIPAEVDLGPLSELQPFLGTLGEVVRIVTQIAEAFDEQTPPSQWGTALGRPLGDALNMVLDHVELPQEVLMGGAVEDVLQAISSFDGELEPTQLADWIAGVLLPVELGPLRDLRATFSEFDRRLATLPDGFPDLEAALSAWAEALEAIAVAPEAELSARISAAATLRGSVEVQLDTAIAGLRRAFENLRCEQWIASLVPVLDAIPRAPAFTPDRIFSDLQAQLEEVMSIIESVTQEQVAGGLARFRASAEAWVDEGPLGQLPGQLDRIEAEIDRFLRGLPHRRLRAELRTMAVGISQQIRDLGIDAVPAAIEDTLAQVRQVLEGDVVGTVQASVGTVITQVNDAVGQVEGILDEVANALSTVIEGSDGQPGIVTILEEIRDALQTFRLQVEAIQAAVAQIDIAGAGVSSAEQLRTLREAIVELLGGDLLPDALRPLLQQAADALSGLDIDGLVFEPAAEATAQLKVELPDALNEALDEAAELLRNAIPTEVIAELDIPVQELANALRGFDPLALLEGVSNFVEQAAQAIESLDPRPHIAPVEAAFQEALGYLDLLDPAVLLEPLAELYDELLAVVQGLDFDAIGDGLTEGIDLVAQPLGEVFQGATDRLTEAVENASADGPSALPASPSESSPDSGGGEGGETEDSDGRLPSIYRPGDAIRALGSLIEEVKRVLDPVDDAVLEPAFVELYGLTIGLSDRLVASRIVDRLRAGLDAALRPLEGSIRVAAWARLERAWTMANARVELEASLSVSGVLTVHTAELAGLRTDIDTCLAGLGGLGTRLAALSGSLRQALPASLRDGEPQAGVIRAYLDTLDPEPLAASIDALARGAMRTLLTLADDAVAEIEALWTFVVDRLDALGPRAIFDRLSRLLARLLQELDVLNPRNLAQDVRPIHQAIRGQLETWSPAALAEHLYATIAALGQTLRALDPANLLGDLTDLDGVADRLEALRPSVRLQPLVDALGEVGDELAALDLESLVVTITTTASEVLRELGDSIALVQGELVELLNGLAQGGASVSIDVNLEVSS